MNPNTKQLQPINETLAEHLDESLEALQERRAEAWREGAPPLTSDPATWDTLKRGEIVFVKVAGHQLMMLVDTLESQLVKLIINGAPAKGRKWELRKVPVGAAAVIGRMLFEVRGRTRKSLKLAPRGYVEEGQ